jgi:hypothetical protein
VRFLPGGEQYEVVVRTQNSRGWGPWSAPKRGVPEVKLTPAGWFSPRQGNAKPNVLARDVTSGRTCMAAVVQIVCFESDLSNHQGRAVTIGDYVGVPWTRDWFNIKIRCDAMDAADIAAKHGYSVGQQFGPRLLQHEAVHSGQWAKSGVKFAVLYAAAEVYARAHGFFNSYEVDANLFWGGYSTYDYDIHNC